MPLKIVCGRSRVSCKKRKYIRHRRTAILLSMELGLPRCKKTVLFCESSEKQTETIKKPTILLQDYSEGPDGVKITRCQWEISHTERNCSWYIITVSHLVYNAVRKMCNRTRSEKININSLPLVNTFHNCIWNWLAWGWSLRNKPRRIQRHNFDEDLEMIIINDITNNVRQKAFLFFPTKLYFLLIWKRNFI